MSIVEVVAGLIFRDGRLLITQRPAGGHLGGLWEFPGGKIEPGETQGECLLRELREELDVEVVVGDLIETVTHAYPGKTVRIAFHRCVLVAGEPRPVGCAAVRWVRREELGGFEFPAADAHLIDRLGAGAEFWG